MRNLSFSHRIDPELIFSLQVEQNHPHGSISVTNYGGKVLFIAKDSDGLAFLSRPPRSSPICAKNLFLSAFCRSARHSIAIQDGIRVVLPRSRLTLNPDLTYRPTDCLTPLLSETGSQVSLLATLEGEVARITRGIDTPLYLHLSGGFDSTALLASLPDELRIRTTATTWIFPFGTAPNDRAFARRAAERFGVRHMEITIDPAALFTLPERIVEPLWSVSSSVGFYGVLLTERAQIHHGTPVVFLNGHGGDHMLADPLPASVLMAVARRSGPVAALRKLFELAHLKSIGIPALLNCVVWPANAEPALPLSEKGTELLKSAAPTRGRAGGFDEWRRALALEALTDNLTGLKPAGVRHLHPFTEGAFPAAALAVPAEELFDRTRTRLPLRAELQAKYGDDLFSRRDKGHVTGAFQVAIRTKFDWLDGLVAGGALAGAGLIDVDACRTALRASAMGVGGVPWGVFRLLSAELIALVHEGCAA